MPHKLLLYGDMAAEMFMGSMTDKPQQLAQYYRDLSGKFDAMQAPIRDTHMKGVMQMYRQLAAALAARIEAAMALQSGYKQKTPEALDEAVRKMEIFSACIKAFHIAFVPVWSREAKGQGMEIIDMRLGGLQGRCQAVLQRLQMYRDGVLDTLTEMDEAEMPYQGRVAADGHTPGREMWGEIITANTVYHQFSI